ERDVLHLCAAIENPVDRADALLRYLRAVPAAVAVDADFVLSAATEAALAHANANHDVSLLARVSNEAAELRRGDIAERALQHAATAAATYSVAARFEAFAAIAGAWARNGRPDLVD